MKTFVKSMLAALALLSASVPEAISQGRIAEFDSPRLKVFVPNKNLANGKAVIVLPGGGYSHLARDHEGYDWAPYFNDHGLTCAVLEYRMPKGDRSVPMADVTAAFKVLTDSAAAWGINPEQIGIMGSSAGGHLAATMSTRGATDGCRPAFQILFYPVISLEDSITHQGTRKGFLGAEADEALAAEWSAYRNVDASTPRAFLALSADDKAVPPANSLLYFSALREAGVPATLMVWPTGGHGWGHRPTFRYHDRVLDELTSWLDSF